MLITLSLLLIALKVIGVISISWLWALAPIWLPLVAFLCFWMIFGSAALGVIGIVLLGVSLKK